MVSKHNCPGCAARETPGARDDPPTAGILTARAPPNQQKPRKSYYFPLIATFVVHARITRRVIRSDRSFLDGDSLAFPADGPAVHSQCPQTFTRLTNVEKSRHPRHGRIFP